MASARRSPVTDPACSLSVTVGRCSNLLTTPWISASTASRWRASSPWRRACRSGRPHRHAPIVGPRVQRLHHRRRRAGRRRAAVALDLLVDDRPHRGHLVAAAVDAGLGEAAGGRPCRAGSRRGGSRTAGSTSRGTAMSTIRRGRPCRASMIGAKSSRARPPAPRIPWR
jgi:hypothetical protein